MRLSWSSNEFCVLCCGDALLLSCLCNTRCPEARHQFVDLPDSSITPITAENSIPTDSTDSVESFVGCHLSSCSLYLTAITSHKRLLLWRQQQQEQHSHSWKLHHSWRLIKRPVDVTFDGDARHILVADKTGDVLQFKTDAESKELPSTILLGHLSMLLSLTMSSCGRLVLSGDRDEKVRVSHYPLAYNIVSFCLGHTEFVSQLRPLPSHPTTLLSASGDGSLRLWNLENGQELYKADTHHHSEVHCIPANEDSSNSPSPIANCVPSKQSIITSADQKIKISNDNTNNISKKDFNVTVLECSSSSPVCGNRERDVPSNCGITSVAVTNTSTAKEENCSLVAVSFERSPCVVMYSFTSNKLNHLATTASLPVPPTTLVWIAHDMLAGVFPPEEGHTDHQASWSPVLVWQWVYDKLVLQPSHSLAVYAAQHWHRFKDGPRMDATMLFKQRYDNVAVYQKKKETRLQQEREREQQQDEPLDSKRIKLATVAL